MITSLLLKLKVLIKMFFKIQSLEHVEYFVYFGFKSNANTNIFLLLVKD